jgi:hypothetical protein
MGLRLSAAIVSPPPIRLSPGCLPQSVTLGDEEAKRRGVQKSVLERAAPPTFDVAVEMIERGKWKVHLDVAQVRHARAGASSNRSHITPPVRMHACLS